MALRAAVAAPRGLRRLFSTSPFSSSLNPPQRPQAEPSTNLFVSVLMETDFPECDCYFKIRCQNFYLFIWKNLESIQLVAWELMLALFSLCDLGMFGIELSCWAGDKNSAQALVCLSKRTTDETLRDTFSAFGEVVHAKIVKHRESGYSKGFGFVKYATLEAAGKAIEGMDGKFLDGWVIFVEYAKPRQPPTLPSQNNTNFQYGRQ
ncbi:RRM domain-containing protein [Citrus sinensis]|nr:RRM domain-containing protein [Citrus sinensis]